MMLSFVSILDMHDCNECVALRAVTSAPMDNNNWGNNLMKLMSTGAVILVGYRVSQAIEKASSNLRDGMPTIAQNGMSNFAKNSLRDLKPSVFAVHMPWSGSGGRIEDVKHNA